jgi:hypothetical protein
MEAMPNAPLAGLENENCSVVASSLTKPTPVNEIKRNELAGTSKRGVNVTLREISFRRKLSWPRSSTMSLRVPVELAATVISLPSIIAANTPVVPGCPRVRVEHGPN